MGRSASHITLEVALNTRPTVAFISEEVKEKKLTLKNIVDGLVDTIIKRSNDGRDFGIILVPEGLIEFIDEFNVMISEINDILAKDVSEEAKACLKQVEAIVVEKLTPEMRESFCRLPQATKDQLLLDRDPHGNVQVAKIETEKLLVKMVSAALDEEKAKGNYKGGFEPKSHYFGYEGRCAFPSNFDCDYCFGLGQTAACLIENKQTGVMSTIKNLSQRREQWIPGGYPLVSMINLEQRKGKKVPVIKKALVELDQSLFKTYESLRDTWAYKDYWCSAGPIQFAMENIHNTAPFLAQDCSVDSLFLSQDVPRIQYKDDQLPYAKASIDNMSRLSYFRCKSPIKLPALVNNLNFDVSLGSGISFSSSETESQISIHLPQLYNNNLKNKMIEVVPAKSRPLEPTLPVSKGQRIGVLFCGRQAPGGLNIVAGLLEFCKKSSGT